MFYLIAVLIVLLILAPLMALLPSPAQRRRARLHRHAVELGLEVRPGLLPQSRFAQRLGDPQPSGGAYRLPARLQPEREGLWCRRDDGTWESPVQLPADAGDQAWLQALETRLPPGIVALELRRDGALLYWLEQGGEAGVEDLHRELQALAEAARPPQPAVDDETDAAAP